MVAIKGMELPKSCAECGFVVDDMCGGATCVLLCDEWKDNENHRAENCPLTEIITCKDCKHNGTMRCKCFMCDGNEYMSYKHPNFYCADAERRE